MALLSRDRWWPLGIRVLVYGSLSAVIFTLQPLPRCYFNVLRETSVIAPCLTTGENIFLRARYRAYALVIAADKFKAAGRLAEAVSASERAFALDPKMEGGAYQVLEMLVAAGRSQRAIKNYANAMSHFSHALDYAPDHPVVLMERAQAYLEIAAFDRAVADVERVIALRPQDGSAYRLRAQLIKLQDAAP